MTRLAINLALLTAIAYIAVNHEDPAQAIANITEYLRRLV